MPEINEVLFPSSLDSALNFPAETEISEASGESINRNRDAILAIERTLGTNPHIGRFTVDPNVATVKQRLDIIENGIAEGRFALRNLNVNNVLVVTTDQVGLSQVDIGSDTSGTRIAPVFIRGPLRIEDSGLSNNQAEIKVPFISSARRNVVEAGSIAGEPLLRITDTNASPNFTNRLALKVEGNVEITNGRLLADFAVDHSQLLGIDTIPRSGVNALHVTRGDHHSHKRKRDPATGALLNEVDPNPVEETTGLVDHQDLLNIFTKTGQTDFVPVEGVAYHVTNGDDHDHKDGRGASIDHDFLLNVNPAISNHVTGGDSHAHTLAGDGALIDHNNLLSIGFLSHADIDRILNIELRNHLELIDPADADQINPANAGLGHHVPLGHVSDPSAHHARYTDEEALGAAILVSPNTTVYQEGRETTVRSHIQAIGSGTVSANNPHGLAAADIGALEGFDPQGNLPDFTRQFLEQAVEDILNDPDFDVLQGGESELVSGLWTFDNAGGINIQDGPGGSTTVLNHAKVSRLDDLIAHVDNTGGSGLALPFSAGQPPFHDALDIRYDPSSSTTPLVSADVGSALDELDGNISSGLAGKEDTLSPSNQVAESELADNAVSTNKIQDGSVTLVKLVNQFAVNSYTFSGHVPPATGTKSFAFLISNIFPSGVIGEVVSVSASFDRTTAGATTSLDLEVTKNGSTILTSSPTDISGFTENVPSFVSILSSPSTDVEGEDAFVIDVDYVGTGELEVSVTVDIKLQHVS